MATTEMIDLRRTDIRKNVLENPFWMTSGEITLAGDDLASVLFSFPITTSVSPGFRGVVLLHDMCCQIITAFAGGTITLDIGACTLATDAVTTGGDTTDVDVDEYIDNTEITHGTPAVYFPATGDWITARLLNTWLAPSIVEPADTTVPAIAAYLASDAAITAGVARVHLLVSVVPEI